MVTETAVAILIMKNLNSKPEIRNNIEIRISKSQTIVWVIRILVFRICLGFRYSDLGFKYEY